MNQLLEALQQIADMTPATSEMTLAHSMGQVAEDAIRDYVPAVQPVMAGTITDDDIIAYARIASTENFYESGKFVRMEFGRSEIIRFARGVIYAASCASPVAPVTEREALRELLAAWMTEMPSDEAGQAAQDAWADRRAAARNNAAFILAAAPTPPEAGEVQS